MTPDLKKKKLSKNYYFIGKKYFSIVDMPLCRIRHVTIGLDEQPTVAAFGLLHFILLSKLNLRLF